MSGYEFCEGYWWIFPLVMIFLCYFFMRRCGANRWCGFRQYDSPKDSAMDSLNKRYAEGGIDQVEYEEKKEEIGSLATEFQSACKHLMHHTNSDDNKDDERGGSPCHCTLKT